MTYLDEWSLKSPEIDTAYFTSELIQYARTSDTFKSTWAYHAIIKIE